MEVHFYLRPPDKKHKTSKSPIQLQVKRKGLRYWWSTGESVHKANWDKAKERVKSINATNAKGEAVQINTTLNDYEREFREGFVKDPKRFPTVDEMRAHMTAYKLSKSPSANAGEPVEQGLTEFHKMIQDAIDLRIKAGKTKTAENLGYIQTALKRISPNLDFPDVTLDWWIDYVKDRKAGKGSKTGRACGGRTISEDLTFIKSIMEDALSLRKSENLEFRILEIDTYETEKIALIDSELDRLYRKKFTSKRLDECRDLCIVAAYAGYRISDFIDIDPDDIQSDGNGGSLFVIDQIKTSNGTTMPIHPAIEKIFKKYPNNPNHLPTLPEGKELNSIKRQFRKDVKTVCEDAGLTETGIARTMPKKKLWELVSPHTFRRSFFTNAYLKYVVELKTMTVADLMFASGKKDEKGFFGYIKLRNPKAIKAMQDYHETIKDKY